jgi:cytochrome c oxidase cbb3-type subunit III
MSNQLTDPPPQSDTQQGENLSDQGENLTDHSYDGIQEYDNPTPGWWTWLFIATIVFSGVYMAAMWLTVGQLSPEEFYRRDSIEALKAQYGQLDGKVASDATLLELAADEKWSKVGQSIFLANCSSCHGGDGAGISAPNLTDDNYINVKTPFDMIDIVTKGRKAGAMPAWENRLLPVERMLVSAYVVSLRGKNLPSPRGVEGEAIPAWK